MTDHPVVVTVEKTGEVLEFLHQEEAYEELARRQLKDIELSDQLEELKRARDENASGFRALREHFFASAESDTGYKTDFGEVWWTYGKNPSRSQKLKMLEQGDPLAEAMKEMGLVRQTSKVVFESNASASEIDDQRKELLEKLTEKLDGDSTRARAMMMEYLPEPGTSPRKRTLKVEDHRNQRNR